MRLSWPLGIAAAGFAATLVIDWRLHPSWTRVEKWESLAKWWLAGMAATLLAATGTWIFRRKSLLHSARKLDKRLAAKSRIETATALREETGALARAQREETAAFLDAAPIRSRGIPLFALIALVVLLALLHFAALVSWTRPWIRPQKAIAAQPSPPPPVSTPKASITWKRPQSETKAAPIEEVPLEAVADSTGGLRDLVLETEVNGEPRPSIPISLDELKTAGKHGIQASLYLDQLDVQPYDMVSYYLRAQRIDPRRLPQTASPVQFVQVKPFRDDVRERPGGGTANPAVDLITALKAAQLRLIKENFLLAHADISHDGADWRIENARVGNEQGILGQKTGEVIQRFIQLGVPAEIVNLISQAKPLMADSSEKILAAQNQPAVRPQGKALGLITEVEKFFIKEIAKGGSVRPGPKNFSDPFKDNKELELKQRFKTLAGELELLVKEQARLADDLSKPDAAALPTPAPGDKPDKNKIEGTLAERQTQISQRIGALLNGQAFVPEVTQHLEQGRDLARDALKQLDATDAPAAREPAASAARELRLASDAMNRAGEEQAKDQLADALTVLNSASEEARAAPAQNSGQASKEQAEDAAKKARETAAKLAEAAQKQQETGSAKEAARLNDLAKELSAADLRKALDRLRENPRDTARAEDAAGRLEKMADRAAQPAAPLSPEEIARVAERLERARVNMRRLASNTLNPAPGNPSATPNPNGTGGAPKPGKSPGEAPGAGPDESPGKGQGAGSDTADTSRQSSPEGLSGPGVPEPSDHGKTQKAPAPMPSGDNSGANYPSGAPPIGPHAKAMEEQFARELIEEVREGSQDAAAVLPSSSELATIRDALRNASRAPRGRLAQVFTQMDPALEGVIKLLRAKTQASRRQYQLTDQSLDLAPPAYRPAVADYFEQLSRDYEPAPKATPEPEKK